MKTQGIVEVLKNEMKMQMEHKKTQMKIVKMSKASWLRSIVDRDNIIVGKHYIWYKGYIVGRQYARGNIVLNWQRIQKKDTTV